MYLKTPVFKYMFPGLAGEKERGRAGQRVPRMPRAPPRVPKCMRTRLHADQPACFAASFVVIQVFGAAQELGPATCAEPR